MAPLLLAAQAPLYPAAVLRHVHAAFHGQALTLDLTGFGEKGDG